MANLVVVQDGRIHALEEELTQLKNNLADVVSNRDGYLNDLKVFGEEKRERLDYTNRLNTMATTTTGHQPKLS